MEKHRHGRDSFGYCGHVLFLQLLRWGSKAPEYGALQTLREYGWAIEFAKRLECAVFQRFSSPE